MNILYIRYKKYIFFFLVIILGIFAMTFSYAKELHNSDIIRVMFLDWERYHELGYSRFYIGPILIYSLIYTTFVSLLMDLYIRKENYIFLIRNKSIIGHILYMIKHFIIKIMLYLLIFISIVSIVLNWMPFNIIVCYFIKNTLAILFILMLYYAISFYIKDNLPIILLITECIILIDTFIGTSFITMNIHCYTNMKYIIIYILEILIILKWIAYCYKKKFI